MLIFDGFESHIQINLIEYCLNHKILPFCLPAHTSHVLQPLEVRVFSALSTYYKQEVNHLRVPVDKNRFPDLLARSRKKAFTKKNIAAGFRATGIWPLDPLVILQDLALPEPEITVHSELDLQNSTPRTPARLKTPHSLLSYTIQTSITLRSIQNTYMEALSTLDSDTNSPRSMKQRLLFEKLRNGAERNRARAIMYQEGEKHLQMEIRQRTEKAKTDTRHVNTGSACILERETVLVGLKNRRDEKEQEDLRRKQCREEQREKRLEEQARKAEEKIKKQEEKFRKLEKIEREKQGRLQERQRKLIERQQQAEWKEQEKQRKLQG